MMSSNWIGLIEPGDFAAYAGYGPSGFGAEGAACAGAVKVCEETNLAANKSPLVKPNNLDITLRRVQSFRVRVCKSPGGAKSHGMCGKYIASRTCGTHGIC